MTDQGKNELNTEGAAILPENAATRPKAEIPATRPESEILAPQTAAEVHMQKALARRRRREEALAAERDRQTAEDEKYMALAIAQARRAFAHREVPIGCVIVKDGTVISRGYNRRNTDHSALSHAETNAIRKACGKLSDWRLEGCTMYVTLEPCPMCAGAIVQSRIDRVVIGAMSPKSGSAGTVLNILSNSGLNHRAQVESGILGEACGALLSDFFRSLRKKTASDDGETSGNRNASVDAETSGNRSTSGCAAFFTDTVTSES